MNGAHDEPRSKVSEMAADASLQEQTQQWMNRTMPYRYTYGFRWLGRPVIQQPQDLIAVQEIMWSLQPDLVIETGVAHGGSLVFSASMLELLKGSGRVVGIDIEIRAHNREAIERHPLAHRITLIEGPSTDAAVVERVAAIAKPCRRVLVMLDSNHTHAHVLEELRLYSPFVRSGSYIIVFDTRVEYCEPDAFGNRPWGKGNNPLTAVREFLATNNRFVSDRSVDQKLLITSAPEGYLRCVKDPA